MTNFLKYFYQDIGRVFKAFLDWIMSFFTMLNYMLNFPMRMEIIASYADDFSTADWVMLLVANILLIAVIVAMLYGIGRLVSKIFRFRVPVKKYDELVKQVKKLQTDLIRANYEKDKLLAMKVNELGLNPSKENTDKLLESLYGTGMEDENGEEGGENKENLPSVNSNRNTFNSPPVDPSTSRFFRLTEVDNYYSRSYQRWYP